MDELKQEVDDLTIHLRLVFGSESKHVMSSFDAARTIAPDRYKHSERRSRPWIVNLFERLEGISSGFASNAKMAEKGFGQGVGVHVTSLQLFDQGTQRPESNDQGNVLACP